MVGPLCWSTRATLPESTDILYIRFWLQLKEEARQESETASNHSLA